MVDRTEPGTKRSEERGHEHGRMDQLDALAHTKTTLQAHTHTHRYASTHTKVHTLTHGHTHTRTLSARFRSCSTPTELTPALDGSSRMSLTKSRMILWPLLALNAFGQCCSAENNNDNASPRKMLICAGEYLMK